MTTMGGHVTVLLTTFQGEAYLEEQLQSVLDQSRPPDLVIVADDASTDRTSTIVADASTRTRVPIRWMGRPTNAGLRTNIEEALAACPPGLVVLADHDDVWAPDKISVLEQAFNDPEVVLWFSDADLIDASGRVVGQGAFDAVHFDTAAQQAASNGDGLDRLLHGMTVVGATMAFRTSLLDWVLPLPSELEGTDHLYLHDGWIAVLAAVRGRIAVEPRRLMQYRQHRDQTTQMSLLHSPDLTARHVADPDQQLLRDQRRVRLVADRIRERCVSDDCGANSAELFRRDEFLSNRVMVRATTRTHRLGAVLRDLVGGNYRSYARGVRTAMRDLTAPTLQIRPSR